MRRKLVCFVFVFGNIRDAYLFGELTGYACPIGGTFFDALCLIMTGFDRGRRVP